MADNNNNTHSSFVAEKVEIESGYASGQSDYTPEEPSRPDVTLTKAHVEYLNSQMEPMHPMDILRFCKIMFPNLFQSTAFGLTGLATMDMLSKIQDENPESKPVELIFLDTLHHFKETYQLVDRVKARYPNVPVNIFRPDGMESAEQFEETYGPELWETADEMYDWIVKVEPLQRAYEELKVTAVLNGRRRSQGAAGDPSPLSKWTRRETSSRSTPWPLGHSRKSTSTSRRIMCPTMLFSTKDTSPLATGTQPLPSRRVRMSAPADGKARPRPSVVSTIRSRDTHSLLPTWSTRKAAMSLHRSRERT